MIRFASRYQSVVAGEAKAESSDDEATEEQVDSSKKIEHCREIGELKAQWESGQVNHGANSATVSQPHRDVGGFLSMKLFVLSSMSS